MALWPLLQGPKGAFRPTRNLFAPQGRAMARSSDMLVDSFLHDEVGALSLRHLRLFPCSSILMIMALSVSSARRRTAGALAARSLRTHCGARAMARAINDFSTSVMMGPMLASVRGYNFSGAFPSGIGKVSPSMRTMIGRRRANSVDRH
jgi:hypothetical protein